MNLSTLILGSGAAYTVVAIAMMLFIISGICVLIKKVVPGKKNWAYYFLLLAMFSGVMLLFDLIAQRNLVTSVISSFGSGALFTFFLYLSDRKSDK